MLNLPALLLLYFGRPSDKELFIIELSPLCRETVLPMVKLLVSLTGSAAEAMKPIATKATNKAMQLIDFFILFVFYILIVHIILSETVTDTRQQSEARLVLITRAHGTDRFSPVAISIMIIVFCVNPQLCISMANWITVCYCDSMCVLCVCVR